MRRAAVVFALVLTVVSLLALATARALVAQVRPAGAVGGDFTVALPVGDFADHVRAGYGGQAEARHFLGTGGWLALRLHGGYVEYARERDWVCMAVPVGCRVELAVRTSSGIGFGGVGPELALPGPVSPYVHASAGLSYFTTQSSLVDHFGGSFGHTVHFDDLVPAWQAGGGVRVQLRGGRRPIAVDLGGEYHRNGRVAYLRPQDIVTTGDGTLVLYPIESPADLVVYRLGLSVGLGGGNDDGRGGWDDRRDRRRRRD
jgi:hypothetical protein